MNLWENKFPRLDDICSKNNDFKSPESPGLFIMKLFTASLTKSAFAHVNRLEEDITHEAIKGTAQFVGFGKIIIT